MTSLPATASPPAIHNRQQLDRVVENIVRIQLHRHEIEQAQLAEIAAVRRKYREPLAETERYLACEMAWVEAWARANPGAFGEGRSLACTHAVIGFQAPEPRVERLSRRWTWSAAAQKLAERDWGRRYLRQPAPEVNKEAILADRDQIDAAELRQVGLKIIQEERFHLTPHGMSEADDLPAAPAEWPEAA